MATNGEETIISTTVIINHIPLAIVDRNSLEEVVAEIMGNRY